MKFNSGGAEFPSETGTWGPGKSNFSVWLAFLLLRFLYSMQNWKSMLLWPECYFECCSNYNLDSWSPKTLLVRRQNGISWAAPFDKTMFYCECSLLSLMQTHSRESHWKQNVSINSRRWIKIERWTNRFIYITKIWHIFHSCPSLTKPSHLKGNPNLEVAEMSEK